MGRELAVFNEFGEELNLKYLNKRPNYWIHMLIVRLGREPSGKELEVLEWPWSDNSSVYIVCNSDLILIASLAGETMVDLTDKYLGNTIYFCFDEPI